jgi:hypothetical protein
MPSNVTDARIRGHDKCSDKVKVRSPYLATAAVTTTSIK